MWAVFARPTGCEHDVGFDEGARRSRNDEVVTQIISNQSGLVPSGFDATWDAGLHG